MSQAAPKIVLSTINARYSHTSFGLRYLKANLHEFEEYCEICEFSKDSTVQEIAEALLNKQADIIGLSCYIWNIEDQLRVAEIIKAISPQTILFLGGPEVSYEYDEFLNYCDYLIKGEGEYALYHFVRNWQQGILPPQKVLEEPICDLNTLKMPYYLYSDEDIAHRLIYVEATRGCPFTCEFCLSSLSKGVREFNLDNFLKEMDTLITRGVKQFKFVDRTFNLKFANVKRILEFFKSRWQEGMMLHFEIFPDKLSPAMLEEIKNFPAHGLHLEAGVQSFFEPSLKAISRRQDEKKTLENLQFISEQTGAAVHSDLVAGLPFSTFATFAQDFDKLFASHPEELQIGILKRLRGAPIDRHSQTSKMIYSKYPPYEVMQTATMSYNELQQIKRLARYFDIFYNAGNFREETKPLKTFADWLDFSNYIWTNYHQTHKISLKRQNEILKEYLNARRTTAAL